MRVLSRSQNPDEAVEQEYLDYAKEIGYDLRDIILNNQRIIILINSHFMRQTFL